MNVLVTGGTGYIGSHTIVELINNNYKVIAVDDLSNSKIEVLNGIKEITGQKVKFYKLDVCDKSKLIISDNLYFEFFIINSASPSFGKNPSLSSKLH